MKEHFVITVGREYGSGGREIAKLVAQKLNVPFYDKELLTLAAQKSGICQEIFEHNDEKTRMSDMLPVTAGNGFGAGMSLGLQMPMNQRVFLAQFEVITNLAKQESCVIVGRCGAAGYGPCDPCFPLRLAGKARGAHHAGGACGCR